MIEKISIFHRFCILKNIHNYYLSIDKKDFINHLALYIDCQGGAYSHNDKLYFGSIGLDKFSYSKRYKLRGKNQKNTFNVNGSYENRIKDLKLEVKFEMRNKKKLYIVFLLPPSFLFLFYLKNGGIKFLIISLILYFIFDLAFLLIRKYVIGKAKEDFERVFINS